MEPGARKQRPNSTLFEGNTKSATETGACGNPEEEEMKHSRGEKERPR